MAAKIVACRFIPTSEREAAEDIDAESQFREEMRREYWHEAVDAGLTTVEAAEYASKMMEN
jgi:hypothetical protein